MLRWLGRALAWTVSVVLRVAFVLAVVGLAAGLAGIGPNLPTDTTELSETVANVESLGDVGAFVGLGPMGGQTTASDVRTVPSSNTDELNGTRLERLVHREVNDERVERGRERLRFDTALRSVARYHSADMANRSYFSHIGPESETLTDRYRRFGYRCRVRTDPFRYATGGENILYTYYDAPVTMNHGMTRYETPEELARGIVNSWMNSTSHRENLLKPYWEREALGIYIRQADGRIRVYATQNFC